MGGAEASPRTFERFTQREGGAVGGVPRRAGLHHYHPLSPSMPPLQPADTQTLFRRSGGS